jgi:hypothetical protein
VARSERRLAPTDTADPHPALRATFSQREKEAGLHTQPSRVLSYRRHDPFGVGESFVVRESENGPAESFQLGLPEMVAQHDIVAVVDAAVDLEDQPEPIAREVREVSSDGVLASKPVAIDPGAAQAGPQAALRQTGGLALIARKSCSAASHGALIGCSIGRGKRSLSRWERA